MKPIDENERNSAAAEFQQSLAELEGIVKPSSATSARIVKPHRGNTASTDSSVNNDKTEKLEKIDLAAWEDAVADIEQYFQQQASQTRVAEVPEDENPN